MERIYLLGMLANINGVCQFLAVISVLAIAALVAHIATTDGKKCSTEKIWISLFIIVFVIAIIGAVATPNRSTVSAMIYSQTQTKE